MAEGELAGIVSMEEKAEGEGCVDFGVRCVVDLVLRMRGEPMVGM